MLTPIDIQKKDFEVKFRGYDSSDVDIFLDMLAKDYEKLYTENIEMRDKIAVLSEAVDSYKAMESTLKDSILLAQKAAEEVRKSASEQAQTIINEANSRAEQIRIQAQNEVAQTSGKLESLKAEADAYKTHIRGICTGILDMLDNGSALGGEQVEKSNG